MEKDSKESSSDDTVGENTENEDSQQAEDIPISEYISKELNKLKHAIRDNKKAHEHLESFIVSVETSQFPTADEKLSVSPIPEPQDLSDDSSVHLSYPETWGKVLKQSEVICDPNEALPQKSSHDETAQSSTESEESYANKGKEPVNPKFRYTKGSKPEVSSIEASCQETTVKPPEDASGAPEIKRIESDSSKADIRTSPAVKRKALDPDENENDETTAKKIKLSIGEKASTQCPTITTLLSHEGAVSSEYTAQSWTDQSRHEYEPMPSTSGLSKVVTYGSSSDESTLFIIKDYFPAIEKDETSITSGSTDATPSESRESTSTSLSMDVPLSEKGDSSVKSSSDFSEIFASTSSDESPSNTDES